MSRNQASQGGAKAWAVLTMGALALAGSGVVYLQTRLPTVVVILGPAEAEVSGRANPGLSAAGVKRAHELVRVLGELPLSGGVAAVFATRYRSSQETAQPLSRHLDLPVQVVDGADHEPLLGRIAADYRGESVIVVTDRGGLRALVDALIRRGVVTGEPSPDRLYVVVLPRIGAAQVVALRYGEPAAAPAGS